LKTITRKAAAKRAIVTRHVEHAAILSLEVGAGVTRMRLDKIDQFAAHARARMDDLYATAAADAARLADATRQATEFLNEQINHERIHRLKLADEQRRYVDGENYTLRRTCEESAMRLNERLSAFRDLGFVGRLRWLLVGV
jgi:hypothetical protein